MRVLLLLLAKEFKQTFRNKAILPIIFIVPIIQLTILPLAANYEIKNIKVSIIDLDHSSFSQKIINKINASEYFEIVSFGKSYNDALDLIESEDADVILQIPNNFEYNINKYSYDKVLISANAINGIKGGLSGMYLGQILQDFNNDVIIEQIPIQSFSDKPKLEIRSSIWFNHYQNFKLYILPGILVMLVSTAGGYLCAVNIVKEKELGTIEQINVSPIKKYQFILGKLIPFWIIGVLIFTVGFWVVMRGIYGIAAVGNIFLIYSFLAIYQVAMLGFGMVISTYSNNQQQSMSIAFFFFMIFILMSGLFTPISSMPVWAQHLTLFNPLRYFIEVMRVTVIKGCTFYDLKDQFISISLFAFTLCSWAIFNYRKTN